MTETDLGISKAAEPAVEPDELDVWLARHRWVVVGLYLGLLGLFVLVSGVIGMLFVPEIPHVVFELFTGQGDFLSIASTHLIKNNFPAPFVHNISIIAIYLALQALVIAGAGKVYLSRRPKRGRTLLSICIIAAVGSVLLVGAVTLFIAIDQTASNRYIPPNWLSNTTLIWMVLGGWVLWMILGWIYWRGRDPERLLSRLLKALLATSWIEFSLALPVDLAARNRESCFCGIASWITLLFAIPVLIWSIGPALWLLYLRERHFSLSSPGRARQILLNKSRRYADQPARKVESQVAAARTTSLALIVLGFIGLQLGIFNYQRGNLFAETRTLILVRAITPTIGSDATLRDNLTKNEAFSITDPSLGYIAFQHTGTNSEETATILGYAFTEPNPAPFSATVGTGDQSWQSKSFSLDAADNEERLERTLSSLSIEGSGAGIAANQLIQTVKDKIYSRRVKLPSLDFGDFSTEAAAWIVSLLCVGIIVTLRSTVRQIFRAADAGNAEEWLVLDARAFGEKLVAGAWIAAIGISTWLATIGLILTVMDEFQITSPRPDIVIVGLTYLAFTAMLILGTWASVDTVADLLRLREIRRVLDEPAPAADQLDS